MRFFKNFKTKRQLREENKRLKFMLHRPEPIHFIEREVQKISSCMELSGFACEIPMADVKKHILYGIADELEPFVEWDIEDSSDKNHCGKIVKGNVYLAKRKRG